MKFKKNYLADNECIIVGDFSENFAFVVQDEIQSHHWSNSQSTVHPFVLYFKKKGELITKSVCVISDCLSHEADTVYAFQKEVINFLNTEAPNVKKTLNFSDGCGGQYKNRKIFINLCFHEKDFAIASEWHFFATSHGKGPCDGIGGTAKRLVAKASLQGNLIKTPEDMFAFCERQIKGIHFIYVTKEDVQLATDFLKDRFDQSATLSETRKYHAFLPIDEKTIKMKRTSFSKEFKLASPVMNKEKIKKTTDTKDKAEVIPGKCVSENQPEKNHQKKTIKKTVPKFLATRKNPRRSCTKNK